MSTYRLDRLFNPRSLVLIGASQRPGSLGLTVARNVKAAGFSGPLYLVNPRYPEIDGIPCFPSIEALPQVPEVAIIATPPSSVPHAVSEAGAKGVAAAIIITAGLGSGEGSLSEEARLAARRTGLRLIGPNCLGVAAPHAKLNASFLAHAPAPSDIALISQSGAVAAGLVEWARARRIGFSAVVSLGDMADVDFGDCLDYFAQDRATRAILLYIESIRDARKFMSAARAAARTKPVVAIKSGRHEAGAKAAATHTGALAGSDAVYEAAFRRAGVLRVYDLDEMFAAAETLGRLKPFQGERLAILTNGGGIGVLAVDRLTDLGGTLAELSPASLSALNEVLPKAWSNGNPVDIIGDADAQRYEKAMEILLQDPANDAILVMNVPTALASAEEAAQAVVDAVKRERMAGLRHKPVLAVWLGADEAATAIFTQAGLPAYANEADAIRGFMHLVRYTKAQDDLMATPESVQEAFAQPAPQVRSIVDKALAEQRTWLDPFEVTQLLEAYGIPIAGTRFAATPEEAEQAAADIIAQGGTVAVKILSPDITHKSDVGGVHLNLTSGAAVRKAARTILENAARLRPDARLQGVSVQAMVHRPKARELIAGLATDPTFGPVIVFGRGGTAVEVINDKALGLPPLDMRLAQDLMARTRVSRILKAYRDVPAADERAVALVLVRLSQLAADLPEVRELDINPLLADKEGVIAVDARIAVAPAGQSKAQSRFAIRPYPKEWERRLAMDDGRALLIRPVRPEDEPLFEAFFTHISAEDLRLRFFAPIRAFPHAFIARLTQIDYARAIAFIAIDQATGEMLGAVRLHADANMEHGDYGILVRSDLKGRGLGWQLMQLMMDWARGQGLSTVKGQVLGENTTMLAMCQKLGFSIQPDRDDPTLRHVSLLLDQTSEGSGDYS